MLRNEWISNCFSPAVLAVYASRRGMARRRLRRRLIAALCQRCVERLLEVTRFVTANWLASRRRLAAAPMFQRPMPAEARRAGRACVYAGNHHEAASPILSGGFLSAICVSAAAAGVAPRRDDDSVDCRPAPKHWLMGGFRWIARRLSSLAAATVRALIDPDTRPTDLNRPGHIFPLRYRPGGVLKGSRCPLNQAWTMQSPRTRAWTPRAMVSTSGSSGISLL